MRKIILEILDTIKVILIAILFAWCMNTFIVLNTQVPTASMESTIMAGSRLVGNRLAYINSEPQYGDIVIFKHPDDESTLLIKRLIGRPGDTIEILRESSTSNRGYILRNGVPLMEDYLNEEMLVYENQTFVIPEDSYFFMGDNRNYSSDARSWEHSYVTRDEIVAKALFQYWKGFKWLNDNDTAENR